MKRVIGIAAFVFCTAASSAELIVHVGSYHTQSKWTEYNNVNLGVGYRFGSGFAVGAYYNSYKKTSVYISKEFMYNESLGVMVGVASGYKHLSGNPVQPMGGGVLKFKIGESTANILVIPPMPKTDGVLHFAISRTP